MANVHDCQVDCSGNEGFCRFDARIKADTHEAALKEAARLHEEQVKIAEEEGPWDHYGLCGKPELYIWHCWECMWDEAFDKMTQEQSLPKKRS